MNIINKYENDYKELLLKVLHSGEKQKVRDGNTAICLFGESIEFNTYYNYFPMLTCKRMYFKNILHELRWIVMGNTNIEYLKKNDVSIWDLWADENGWIGDTYGKQLRDFNGVDQLANTLNQLRDEPESRQHVISLWNPVSISEGNLKPCYHSFQFVVINKTLNIIVSQRSADIFVGLPYDVAVFTLLMSIVCNQFNFTPGKVKINIGNAHIYKEHIEPVEIYMNRQTKRLPTINNYCEKLVLFNPDKIKLQGYNPEPFIKAKIII